MCVGGQNERQAGRKDGKMEMGEIEKLQGGLAVVYSLAG